MASYEGVRREFCAINPEYFLPSAKGEVRMEEEDRYVDEFGRRLEIWHPKEAEKRGRHNSFSSAAEAALSELLKEKNPFFDSLADEWPRLFPDLPARPGYYEDGKLILHVKSSGILFSLRRKLAEIKKRLQELPDAPKKFDVILQIRK